MLDTGAPCSRIGLKTMKPKICYIYTDWAQRPDKLYGGVGYYRVVKPAKYLQEWFDVDYYGEDLGKLATTADDLWQRVFEKYDAVVVKQVDNEMAAGRMLFFARQFNKPLLLDLDDNYIEVRPDQPAYKVYYPGSQKRSIFHAVLSLVDGVIVSTQPLADFYKKRLKSIYNLDTPIFVAPNCVDPDDWGKVKKTRKKVIGYAGSITHNGDLAVIMPSLAKLMKENKDWHLEMLGSTRIEDVETVFKDFDEETFKRVNIKGGTHSWKGYPELLCSQGWDVGLAPLIDDEFNRGKSHIKWMEYALSGIPTIASRVYPYYISIDGTPIIEDGKTGLLFDNPKEFEQKLCSLLKDDKIRNEIAENAKKAVIENWHYKKHIHKWRRAIDSVCSSMIPPPFQDLSKPAKTTQT